MNDGGDFLNNSSVKETSNKYVKNTNDSLYSHIYYEAETNQNALAVKLGIQRQYLNGLIHRRIQCPIPLAQKICKELGVKSIHTLFKQSDIYYPNFQSADKIIGESVDNKPQASQSKDGGEKDE